MLDLSSVGLGLLLRFAQLVWRRVLLQSHLACVKQRSLAFEKMKVRCKEASWQCEWWRERKIDVCLARSYSLLDEDAEEDAEWGEEEEKSCSVLPQDWKNE